MIKQKKLSSLKKDGSFREPSNLLKNIPNSGKLKKRNMYHINYKLKKAGIGEVFLE